MVIYCQRSTCVEAMYETSSKFQVMDSYWVKQHSLRYIYIYQGVEEKNMDLERTTNGDTHGKSEVSLSRKEKIIFTHTRESV